MAGTQVWRTSRMLARTSRRGSSDRRVRARLWTLLNAPGLLPGSAASADSAASMEDDYRRFTGPSRGY